MKILIRYVMEKLFFYLVWKLSTSNSFETGRVACIFETGKWNVSVYFSDMTTSYHRSKEQLLKLLKIVRDEEKHHNWIVPEPYDRQMWICGGCYYDKVKMKKGWFIHGIFDSENKAVAACKDESYFVRPIPLNKPIYNSFEWEGVYYPLSGKKENLSASDSFICTVPMRTCSFYLPNDHCGLGVEKPPWGGQVCLHVRHKKVSV